MNDPNEKIGTEATTDTKDELVPQPAASTKGEVSDAELEGVAGGIGAGIHPPGSASQMPVG